LEITDTSVSRAGAAVTGGSHITKVVNDMGTFINGVEIEPKPMLVSSLPTPAAAYLGLSVRINPGGGARSRTYRCEVGDAGTYLWVEVVNGGA